MYDRDTMYSSNSVTNHTTKKCLADIHFTSDEQYLCFIIRTLQRLSAACSRACNNSYFGSAPGMRPTMLQAAKRGAGSLPLLTLINPTKKYYFQSLPRVALLSRTSAHHTHSPLRAHCSTAVNHQLAGRLSTNSWPVSHPSHPWLMIEFYVIKTMWNAQHKHSIIFFF
jgi:hypothetical protein